MAGELVEATGAAVGELAVGAAAKHTAAKTTVHIMIAPLRKNLTSVQRCAVPQGQGAVVLRKSAQSGVSGK